MDDPFRGMNGLAHEQIIPAKERTAHSTAGTIPAQAGTLCSKERLIHVMGAEIWVKVGEPPPSGPSELTFLSLATRTPHVAEFPGTDGGKTAHYMLRWIATTGEKGPWSETASATIGA